MLVKNVRCDTIRIEKRTPSLEEYRLLRSQSNRDTEEDPDLKNALENDLHGIMVFDGPNIIGIGLLVSHGAHYFYIQDITVHPKHRKQGVGRLIMDHIEYDLGSMAAPYAYVGLIAARGTKEFYKKFGFIERKSHCQGMFKILTETELNEKCDANTAV